MKKILDIISGKVKIKDAVQTFKLIDDTIGFKKFAKYVSLCIVLFLILNFKSIIKSGVELVQEVQNEIHTEKMLTRDELLKELSPMLQEFRAETGADRILYFEYHNSKENLVGIPFKYMDMVLQNPAYGIPYIPESSFADVNTGAITNLYEVIKTGKLVCCKGSNDTTFNTRYPGIHDLFKRGDGSETQVFISIPGINQPIGLIVLEWVNEENTIDLKMINEIAHGSNSYISRINGLIMSKM